MFRLPGERECTYMYMYMTLYVCIWQFVLIRALCNRTWGPLASAQGQVGLCQGKGAHKVEQPCARAGGAQGHAQGRTRTHKVAHKVTDRHPRTRSRKLNRAQGQVALPGGGNAQGAHKVLINTVWEQGSGQSAIYIYIYIYRQTDR